METHKKLRHIYVGIDCHKQTHTAGIINAFHEQLGTITFENNKEGFNSLFNFVQKFTDSKITAIYGLEDSNHLGHAYVVTYYLKTVM